MYDKSIRANAKTRHGGAGELWRDAERHRERKDPKKFIEISVMFDWE